MAEKVIAEITHYFDKLGVAVLKLKAPLAVGDKINVKGGEVEFEQVIDSMQVDREPISKAKKGDDVGMKMSQKVNRGYKIYKMK